MKNLIILAIVLFSTSLFSQDHGSIRGTVLDQEMNNEPMLFAHVELKGADTVEQSNLFGNFEINDIEPGAYILEISQAGYETKMVSVDVKADGVTEIQESLAAMTFSFDEVITEEKTVSIAKLSSNRTAGDDKE